MANTLHIRLASFLWNLEVVLILGLFVLGGWVIADICSKRASHAVNADVQSSTSVMQPPVANQSNYQEPVPSSTGPNTDPAPPDTNNAVSGEQAPGPVKNLPTVCIDPGHPSEVNSATTEQNGLTEVEVVYDVAQKLKQKLEAPPENDGNPIARVVMTRNFRGWTGKIVTNRARAEIANREGAVLLVRLHCDTGKGSGYTIYYPDRVGRTRDGKTGPSKKVIAESGKAARAFHNGMASVLHDPTAILPDNGVKGDSATYIGGKQGALTGSIYSKVPTLTVEMVYLSNRNDAKFIGSEQGKDDMADALMYGVIEALEASGYR
ncbi:MAG TPA: N-acetylmuramoyl-L-alanine amidase [Armatimonadota bacterium]|nr:N-acetylmuramoyl-L-alanine amidase [Armatimonadota bacterium]